MFMVIHLLVLCYSPSIGIANDVTRLAILPFQLNADEDIEYINSAVRDMLTSRITYGTDVALVERGMVKEVLSKVHPGKLTQRMVQEFGRTLGVDYVVFGSITKIGNNLSIDISVLNVLQGGIIKPVFTQSIGLDEVIPKMNGLAQGIKDTIATGFEGLLPTTTSVQSSEPDETLLEGGLKTVETVPTGIEEANLTSSDGSLEKPGLPPDEVTPGE